MKILIAAVAGIVLAMTMPWSSYAQDAGGSVFAADAAYDIYLNDNGDKGLLIHQVNIIGSTKVGEKTMLIIQPRSSSLTVIKGYVLLDKIATILPADKFLVTRVNN